MSSTFKSALCFVLVFSFMPALSAAEHPALSVIKSTVEEMVGRIGGDRQALEMDSSRLYALVDDLVTPNFDFETISKWVLAGHWEQASAAQRDVFSAQFRLFLIRTYARALLKSSNVQIEYLPLEETKRPDLVVVKAAVQISAASQPLVVGYRMKERDGRWKVVDIVIDGVSLIKTYRGSFGTTIEKVGMDSLLAELREKNDS